MKRLACVLVLLATCSVFSSQVSAGLLPSVALSSAETFVAAVDKGDLQAAYAIASPLLRLRQKQGEWVEEQGLSFKLLGKTQGRQLMVVRSRESYPGLPDGNYLIISYQTRTEFKSEAVEVLLLKEQDKNWEVCKYSIR